jgi:hypothetical protein
LCLILEASALAGDAFHKSIPILRLVAGIETTGFPGTGDWEMGPVVLFCTLAPEVHANTNLFQKQRGKKDNNERLQVTHTINKHEVKASLLVSSWFLQR